MTGLARANLTGTNPDSIEVANPRANTETNPMLLHCQAPDVVGQMLDSKATPKPGHSFTTRAQLGGITKMQSTVSKHADSRVRPQVDCHTNGETAPQPEHVMRQQVSGCTVACQQSIRVLPEHVNGIGSTRSLPQLARMLLARLLKGRESIQQPHASLRTKASGAFLRPATMAPAPQCDK